MRVIGISGLDRTVDFKKARFPGLSRREYRIAQGFDSAAALVTDDGIVAAAAEERFSREKATHRFPAAAIRFCLEAGRIRPDDVDFVAHGFDYGAVEAVFQRGDLARARYQEVYAPEVQLRALEEHFPDSSWKDRFVPVDHHLAHAASAFYPSGMDEALVVVTDGMGELHSMTAFVGSPAGLEVIREVFASDSLGVLYGVFTLYLGFAMGMDEYKIMGLAPYGDRERFRSRIMEWIELRDDGTYGIPLLAADRTELETETHAGVLRVLADTFGPPRSRDDQLTQHHMDIAAGLQAVLETVQLHVVETLQKETGLRNLCMAGGVALNCTANGVIRRSGLFDRMFVQPGAGDDGTALGAALYVHAQHRPFTPKRMTMPLWGPGFDHDAIRRAVEARKDEYTVTAASSEEALLDDVADRIAAGQIVAWFQGRMEFGPRALGSRSILADPRGPDMRDRINALVKKREGFRPFAPAIIAEEASRYFEIEPGDEQTFSHMLYVTPVRPAFRSQLPAITHVDGSARAQTVHRDQHPRFWALLRAVGDRTGIPAVLNTSFNVAGQPIVCTPEEAIDTFLMAKLDALAIGDYVLARKDQEQSVSPTEGALEKKEAVPAGGAAFEAGPTVALPNATTILDMIAAAAARTPSAVAVQFGNEVLTYDELMARVDAFAARLVAAGVAAGDLVGVYVPRSHRTVVALLGVMRAGGAYVPLDPTHPAERVQSILEDAGVRVLVSERSVVGTVESSVPKVVFIEDEPGVTPSVSFPAVGPEDLAYVMYTSGSTGKPKGVEIPHRAFVNFLDGMRREPGFTAADVLLAVTTVAFDISGLELFLPLSVGGRVHVAPAGAAGDPELLGELLRTSRATVLQATPATWRLLVDAGWAGSPTLRAFCGGEALPRDLAMALVPRVAELWNMYGPTETTIWSSVRRVRTEDDIVVGLPMQNTTFYVLDGEGRRVPDGTAGELWIGGLGVARGYHNRDTLTAERFVPDPFAADGTRMYRTGDSVTRRADGALLFHGRLDHQVKVRGFRIELGEIETALMRHDDIREAVVVAVDDAGGNRQLVAYVVLAPDCNITSVDLRSFLGRSLPDYMVPSGFVRMDRIPLTPNGKVDRRALPDPALNQLETGTEHVAPQSELEKAIVGVWQEVLRKPSIGTRDNFFDLGGNSLMVMQVAGKLRRVLGRDVPLVHLYTYPTVESLAQSLAATTSPDGALDRSSGRGEARRQRLAAARRGRGA